MGVIHHLEVGKQFLVERFINPFGRKPGIFHTTEVMEIQNDFVKTKNSTYTIQKL